MLKQPLTARPVLYLTRNGLLEPLGQSQILPYLSGLSKTFSFVVLAFEKPADCADLVTAEAMRQKCATEGITWISFLFRSQPRPWAPIVAFAQLALAAFHQFFFLPRPQLVHARSYVPAAIVR